MPASLNWISAIALKRFVLGAYPLILTASLCSVQPAESPKTPLSLTLPVKCEVGKSCLVQKLVDHDPGPARKDYRCGLLTTDAHDGVDIRLRTMQDMEAGYEVVAAAPGVVRRTRDGEPDISSRIRTERDGKDAGNGVVIDHGGGWETQYSHLKAGSVGVRPNQKVVAGDRIGLIGMSGNSEFPHLHFSIRHGGKTIDPFTGTGISGPCSANAPAAGIWSPATARVLAYQPTVAITAGFASEVPPRSVADRAVPPLVEGRQAPLLLWVDVIGARDGDVQEFGIAGPNGKPMHVQQARVASGGLNWFAYSGKRAPPSGWEPGRYTGRYVLKRDGRIIMSTETHANMP